MKQSEFKSIPSHKKRSQLLFSQYDENSHRRLLHAFKRATYQLCTLICPADPQGLMNAGIESLANKSVLKESLLVENIRKVAKALKGTVQADVLMAPVAKTYPAKVLLPKFRIGKMRQASLRRKFMHMASGGCLRRFRDDDGGENMKLFRKDIDEIFENGEEDKSSCEVFKELKDRHPHRLDLPTESEVGERVAMLMAKRDKKRKTVTSSSSSSKRQTMVEPYSSTVASILEEDPDILPGSAWDRFRELHPPKEDDDDGGGEVSGYPSELQVKRKISALKVKLKKMDGDGEKTMDDGGENLDGGG